MISSTYRYNESNGFLSEEIIATSRATARLVYDFDNFDRLDSVSYYLSDLGINSTLENRVEYVYYEPDDLSTSNRVSEFISTIGNQEVGYSYTYDSDGNITKITYSNGKVITYTYDALGQLKSENNNIIGASYTYTYDDSGNLVSTSKIKHSSGSNGQIGLVSIGDGTESVISPLLLPLPIRITNTYSYTNSEWGDLLTAFNGTAITYDEIGNPLSYYNGSSYTFTWRGRELISAVKGSKNMSFVYNDERLRVSKTVNGVTTYYIYDGSLLLAEYTDTQTTVYIYDATGSPIGFKYRASSYATDVWDVYWYEKNLQGDIVAIYNTNGTKLVTYGYNAWGVTSVSIINGLVSTTAVNNNLTYRGYYYDTDLGMYYLQSRYYDPAICRFINADGYVSTGQGILGYNMFAYCGNNPVMRVDPNGEGWVPFAVALVVIVITLTSCSKIENANEATPNTILNDKTSFDQTPEELIESKGDVLDVHINIEDYKLLSLDDDKVQEYADLLADDVEANYHTFLNDNSIDRVQLYGEIKCHIISWDLYFKPDQSKSIHIQIYSDGTVYDGRPEVDTLSRIIGEIGYD